MTAYGYTQPISSFEVEENSNTTCEKIQFVFKTKSERIIIFNKWTIRLI